MQHAFTGTERMLCAWSWATQQLHRAILRAPCSTSGLWLRTTRNLPWYGTPTPGLQPAQAACATHRGYLLGMVKKHPDSVPLMVLLGNSHMITVGTIFSHTYLPYSKQESWPAIRLCMISGCFASAVLNGMPLGQRTADSLAAGVCARLSMHPDVSVHDKLVVAAGLRSTDEGCRSYRTTLLCTNGICEKGV